MSEKSTYRNEILIKCKIKELVRGIKRKKSTVLQQSTSFFILSKPHEKDIFGILESGFELLHKLR